MLSEHPWLPAKHQPRAFFCGAALPRDEMDTQSEDLVWESPGRCGQDTEISLILLLHL